MAEQKYILVVEDEDDHFELIQRGVEGRSSEFLLDRARSLREARQKIVERLPDLVITDWKLPDGDGIALITSYPSGACRYPVVVMTSHGNEAWAVNAIKLGALDYIVKTPEALSGMERVIERALREWTSIVARKAAEEEREHLIGELRKALEKVKTLTGLLPICASCKKIKNDDGYWQQIEVYVSRHSMAEFSHGLCPECAKRIYPQYYKDASSGPAQDEGSGGSKGDS